MVAPLGLGSASYWKDIGLEELITPGDADLSKIMRGCLVGTKTPTLDLKKVSKMLTPEARKLVRQSVGWIGCFFRSDAQILFKFIMHTKGKKTDSFSLCGNRLLRRAPNRIERCFSQFSAIQNVRDIVDVALGDLKTTISDANAAEKNEPFQV
ncbi:MAG: hypothetical protein LBB26_00220 [Puniceicoccales bacterium]|jgi:hypothetical protein|nr:hypothetical protein [Puniceicoccales bacterium]